MPAEDRTERVSGLDILTRAHIAEGQVDQAQAPLDELRTIAETVGTEPLAGDGRACRRMSALGQGRPQGGVQPLRGERHAVRAEPYSIRGCAVAARSWRTPYWRSAGAIPRQSHSGAAGTTFEQLGAARHAAAARILLQEIDLKPHGPIGPVAKLGRLTAREIEVLRLVAQGLNDKEAAAQLKLSEHTIHRHVGNILTKTGLPSRAAAVAQAARSGLL